MPAVLVDGVYLHYEDTERVSGPVLLQLHGLGADLSAWDEHVPAFAERYRLIRVDLPGHGRSGSPPGVQPYLPGSQAERLAGLLAALGVERAHVLGHDLGGVVALAFALGFARRLQALVLEDTSPEALPEAPRFAGRLLADPARAGGSMTGRSAAAEALRRFAGVVPRLQFIEAPTLVVAGEADAPFFQQGAELLHGWIPFSRLVRIPQAGHVPHAENPAAFAEQVLAFLHDVESER